MGGSVEVLGRIRYVATGGDVVTLASEGQRRLLAVLAAAGGNTVRSVALGEALGLGPSAVRTSVSRLRGRVGDDAIETDGPGYRLAAEVDADRFLELVGRSGDIPTRLATLDAAIALWNGAAYEEFSHEEWIRGDAIRLDELRLVAMEDRAELLIAAGRSGEAAAALESLVVAGPYRDRARGLLIQALAGDGRRADAMRAYQEYRRFVVDQTGTEPSAAVQDIEQRVARGIGDEAERALARAKASGLVTEGSTDLPSGILTFVFTDIEDSSGRWEQAPDRMQAAMDLHEEILNSTIADDDGVIFTSTGDGVGAVFTSAANAVAWAIETQRRFQSASWPDDDRLKVRIGLSVGEGSPTRGGYIGAPVHRAARIADLANGDQIAVPMSITAILGDVEVEPVGQHNLRGIGPESIGLVTADGLLIDDRPLRSKAVAGKTLPTQPHRLIGRDSSVHDVVELLAEHQAVTLVGPGGVGKTRLAIAVGMAATKHFGDGVVLCELEHLGDGDAVDDAVAESLGARVQPDMGLIESIVDFLEGRRVLIILDNCEHVTGAARAVGREVLKLDGVTVLPTSREPVGLPAEQLFGVDPLDPEIEGVELFLERATERDRSFAPSAEDLEHIAKICARLDGIPLGIELAAAWVRVLSPAQLVEHLADRFRARRVGRSGGRHETLRDTVLWSYEQLDELQARMFERLSVFSGPFSLDAAEAVCPDGERIASGDVLDLITALVEKSMVTSVREAGRVRFVLLGTLRQFGQERLDTGAESERFRRRHAHHYRDLAATGAALLISDREPEVWETFDHDWVNLRTAYETMVDLGDVDGAVQLVLELGWFAGLSMRFELFSWVDELMDRTDVDGHPDAGSLHGLRAMAAYLTVDLSSADHANRGLAIDPGDRYGYCRLALAAISLNNDFSAPLSEALTADWLEHLDDESPLASRIWAEGMRTFHLCVNDPSPQAADHAAVLADLADATGSTTATALAHWAGGMVASFDGVDHALDRWRQGQHEAASLHTAHLVEDLIVGLILHFTVARGDLATAIDGTLAAVERAVANHYLAGTSHLFGVTAIVLCRTGQADTAATLLGAMTANGHLPRPNAVRAVERVLGEEADEARSAGSGLSINEATAVAVRALREASRAHGVEA